MAIDPKALRSLLRRPDEIGSDPFGVLRQIAELISEDRGGVAVEMVLRALDHRDAFGPHSKLLDTFARHVGLFPYAEPELLSLRDKLAYEFHRPLDLGETVFHSVQAEVYRRLMAGENLILSPPTSFGKSRIIDAMVASDRYQNIAVIVPTLALIDETRRRLAVFGDRYKVVTHLSQSPAERNLFVFTAERAVAYKELPRIDFFVIDEFYTLGAMHDEDRMVSLNHAFYKLQKGAGQFYLLGPNINRVPQSAEATLRCSFIRTDFHTVVSEVHRIKATNDDRGKLIELAGQLNDQTLVFCSSPNRVNEIATALLESGVGIETPSLKSAANWVVKQFHSDWIYGRALVRGIGIHHGRLPRSLAQFVVRAFNDEKLRFLICTSTLIEGVNTKAKNVVIFDNKIARKKIDHFTFNNIKGRSGRMFQHFIGHVYVFGEPPTDPLPFVDIPLISQGADTPTSLLIQMEPSDLTSGSSERLRLINSQSDLPVDVIKQNGSIAPESQIKLAKHIAQNGRALHAGLDWRFPTNDQLRTACTLIWDFLVSKRQGQVVTSAKQLAFKVSQLFHVPNVRDRVAKELEPGTYAAPSANEAVERVLGFERNWASFEFPRFLMALSRIQAHVYANLGLSAGDYGPYSTQVESLFRPPVVTALEEYGLPLQIGERLVKGLGTEDDLDTALARLKKLDGMRWGLSAFELSVLQNVKDGL